MIEDLSRRYDYRLHALLRPSLAHGIIIRILDRIKREKCLANWLASRGRSYRGLFPPAERNVFAKFSYKAGFLEKSTSNCWRQKSGYRREIYIYIKFGKRGRHKLYPTVVVIFPPTFPLFTRATFVTFSSKIVSRSSLYLVDDTRRNDR